MKKAFIASALLALSTLAAAQTAPAAPNTGVTLRGPNTPVLLETRTVTITRAERPMVWGGLASEWILPGVGFAVSAPIYSKANLNVALRGGFEGFLFYFPFTELNGDLLFSAPQTDRRAVIYGGPSIGRAWILGGGSTLMTVGGVLGVRNDFGNNLGLYGEAKVKYVFASDGRGIVPGLRFGLTYRF